MSGRRARTEEALARRVEQNRERLFEQTAALGAAFRTAANPLRLLKRDAVGLTVAALAAGLMIGLLGPGGRSSERRKKKAPPESGAPFAPLTAAAAGLVPVLVRELVAMRDERRRGARARHAD